MTEHYIRTYSDPLGGRYDGDNIYVQMARRRAVTDELYIRNASNTMAAALLIDTMAKNFRALAPVSIEASQGIGCQVKGPGARFANGLSIRDAGLANTQYMASGLFVEAPGFRSPRVVVSRAATQAIETYGSGRVFIGTAVVNQPYGEFSLMAKAHWHRPPPDSEQGYYDAGISFGTPGNRILRAVVQGTRWWAYENGASNNVIDDLIVIEPSGCAVALNLNQLEIIGGGIGSLTIIGDTPGAPIRIAYGGVSPNPDVTIRDYVIGRVVHVGRRLDGGEGLVEVTPAARERIAGGVFVNGEEVRG